MLPSQPWLSVHCTGTIEFWIYNLPPPIIDGQNVHNLSTNTFFQWVNLGSYFHMNQKLKHLLRKSIESISSCFVRGVIRSNVQGKISLLWIIVKILYFRVVFQHSHRQCGCTFRSIPSTTEKGGELVFGDGSDDPSQLVLKLSSDSERRPASSDLTLGHDTAIWQVRDCLVAVCC